MQSRTASIPTGKIIYKFVSFVNALERFSVRAATTFADFKKKAAFYKKMKNIIQNH